jgi:hypothetical protein
MSTVTKPTKILIAGLQVDAAIPEYFRNLYGTPNEIKAKIDADSERVRAAGYDVTTKYLYEDDQEAGLAWLAEKLQSEMFEGIMIGSGLRLIPGQTAFYEKVMNVVRQQSPGSVLMFNDGPGGNWDAIKRNDAALKKMS